MEKERKKTELTAKLDDSLELAGTGTAQAEVVEPGSQAVENENPESSLAKESGGEAEKEAERIAKIDMLFESYPLTRDRLCANTGFKVDGGTERFMAGVGGFMRGSGKTPEDIDESLSMLYSIGFGVATGELTLDMLDIIVKGSSHDKVLEESMREAELRGRNANIEAKMRERAAGDGVPHPGTFSGASPRTKSRGIFSLAESARR